MTMVHAAPDESKGWLSRLMTTDFCPSANRFVYWLKEPVGWFALATAISVMIGQYVSPIGWTLAASLTALIIVGMAWPWIAVRVTRCTLHPESDAVHEDTACRMVLSVRNRIPVPVWGLVVEGYLDAGGSDSADGENQTPTVGLACVPPLCSADYAVQVRPMLRGHYPVSIPQATCSFPFGIWTARQPLGEIQSLTVWPTVHRIAGMMPLVGLANADQGDGSRGGRSGDYVGVRSFRRGDSAKHVNWIASARSESLIVTERGGPQSVQLDVFIDTRMHSSRESLARQIRVAASVLSSLHKSRIETKVRLGDHRLSYKLDERGHRKMLDALASVPMDGENANGQASQWGQSNTTHASVSVSGTHRGEVLVAIRNPRGGRRAGGEQREIVIAQDDNLATAIAEFWREVRDVDSAA